MLIDALLIVEEEDGDVDGGDVDEKRAKGKNMGVESGEEFGERHLSEPNRLSKRRFFASAD
ncbi:hypothetical protein MMC30_004003 [Trapelia coarctata]|nr:hypothetical protein [Trapelia coarctata]